MRTHHRYVQVRISQRILFVDREAYPLRHVARIRPIDFTPNYKGAVRRFARNVAPWTGAGLAGVLAFGCMGGRFPAAVWIVLAVVVIGMQVRHVSQLIRVVSRPDLHVLCIETARPQAAVVSSHRELIQELSNQVIAAIDNPDLEYSIRIDHIENVEIKGDDVHGHKIVMGDDIVGEKVHSG